jgi:serine phosphatase RsbU (regulator of sigma subunit)
MTTVLLEDVRAFAGTAPQSDDIAILALKVNSAGMAAQDMELAA